MMQDHFQESIKCENEGHNTYDCGWPALVWDGEWRGGVSSAEGESGGLSV